MSHSWHMEIFRHRSAANADLEPPAQSFDSVLSGREPADAQGHATRLGGASDADATTFTAKGGVT